MMWNGIHLLISPAASHSGWEDNWQSDQFHYLHHVKFECNYGTSGPPLDKIFGTFREKLGKSDEYKGESKDSVASVIAKDDEPIKHEKYLRGPLQIKDAVPTKTDSTFFNSLYLALFATFGLAVVGQQFVDFPYTVSAAFGVGPVVAGMLTLIIFGDKKPMLWPFHKENLVGGLGFHLLISTVMVLAPTYHFASTMLLPQGQAVYFQVFPQ